MKTAKTLLTLLIVVMLSSCSFLFGSDSASIKAEGDEIEGVSADQLAVESDTYTLSANKKSKDSDTWVLQICLKLSKNTDASLTALKGTPVLQLLDEDGEAIDGAELKIGEGSLDVKTLENLRTLLTDSRSGQMLCSFYLNITDKKQKNDIMKRAKRFVIKGLGGRSTTTSSRGGLDGTYNMQGQVDKYPVTMELTIDGNQVNGKYYYLKANGSRNSSTLTLSGTNDNGELNLNEVTPNGTPSGHFMGNFVDGIFSGTFVNNQGKKMQFVLSEGDIPVDMIEESDGLDVDDTSSYNDNGDASIDDYLDEYERYVDNYIKLIKKLDKNDPSFALEYAEMLQDYNRLAEKGQRLQGNMSVKQAERFNRITMKMSNAMQKMQ